MRRIRGNIIIDKNKYKPYMETKVAGVIINRVYKNRSLLIYFMCVLRVFMISDRNEKFKILCFTFCSSTYKLAGPSE